VLAKIARVLLTFISKVQFFTALVIHGTVEHKEVVNISSNGFYPHRKRNIEVGQIFLRL
jgi:hypothetical protein